LTSLEGKYARDGADLSDPRQARGEESESGSPSRSNVGLEGIGDVELLLVLKRSRIGGGGGRGSGRDGSPFDQNDGKFW